MPWQQVVIDESILSEGGAGRIRVDEGDYLGVIAGVRPTSEDYDGPPAWIWQLRIKEGSGNLGRSIGFWGTFKKDAQFGTGRLLSLIGKKTIAEQLQGQTIETYAQFSALAKKVADATKGKEIGFYAGDDPSSGGKYSSITEIYPAEEYRERVAVYEAAEEPEDGEAAEAPPPAVRRGRGRPPKPAAPAAAPAAVPAAASKKNLDAMLGELGFE